MLGARTRTVKGRATGARRTGFGDGLAFPCRRAATMLCPPPDHTGPDMPRAIDRSLVTTANELPDLRIVRSLGVARGIAVRSRSIIGSIGGSLQTLFGGNITLFAELCVTTREEAFRLLLEHAADIGANAIIGMRFDANEVAAGVTEVLAYGTAVLVEPR
jgi:uncharacterized protein YbjQ (UPF0145 family)